MAFIKTKRECVNMMLNADAEDGKHMLNTSWTFWYDKPSSGETTWGENTIKIYSFDCVEDFWRLVNNLVSAVDLVQSSNYHLFREEIEPKWEDPENAKGGRWIHYHSRNEGKDEYINQKWINTMLACIGEDFPNSEEVKGCVFSSKKNQIRISLWVGDAESKNVKLIGSKFKNVLDLEEEKIIFHSHQESSGGTFYNALTL
ncbi:Eukaryotic translation initiation factor 4E [Entamoeba marina]